MWAVFKPTRMFTVSYTYILHQFAFFLFAQLFIQFSQAFKRMIDHLFELRQSTAGAHQDACLHDTAVYIRKCLKLQGTTHQQHYLCQNPNMRPFLLMDMAQDRNFEFTIWGSVGTRSAVVFDLDQDGDLDIVTSELNDVPQVLVSNLADRGEIHYLEIRLTGTESNRNGLGATVRVHAGERTFTKYHDGKSGYLSQNGSQPLYFGLGEATSVNKIEISWPSGRKQTLSDDITVNSILEIVEE